VRVLVLLGTVALSRAVEFVDVRVRETVVRLVAVGAELREPLSLVIDVRDLEAVPRSFDATTIGPLDVITVRILSGLFCVTSRLVNDLRA
jgi:hypothetical protein